MENPFLSYDMENPSEYIVLEWIYVVQGHILGEVLSDVVQYSLL